ncbi:MAG: Hpt domain-containing protein, partial [Terrimicrobiaceae bacterium]
MSAGPSVIDWEQLDAIADGWPADFVEIFEGFLTDLPNEINALADAISTQDPAAIASTAHRAKGCAANFGFQGVYLATLEIESLARANSLENMPALLTQAIEAMEAGAREVSQLRSPPPRARA